MERACSGQGSGWLSKETRVPLVVCGRACSGQGAGSDSGWLSQPHCCNGVILSLAYSHIIVCLESSSSCWSRFSETRLLTVKAVCILASRSVREPRLTHTQQSGASMSEEMGKIHFSA